MKLSIRVDLNFILIVSLIFKWDISNWIVVLIVLVSISANSVETAEKTVHTHRMGGGRSVIY